MDIHVVEISGSSLAKEYIMLKVAPTISLAVHEMLHTGNVKTNASLQAHGESGKIILKPPRGKDNAPQRFRYCNYTN